MSVLTRVGSNETMFNDHNPKFLAPSVNLNSNELDHFTLQILPKREETQQNIRNDLTGNTLVTNKTGSTDSDDFNYNDHYINNSNYFKNAIFNNVNEKRLSISDYNTDKPSYYEYETLELNLNEFGVLSPHDDTDLDGFSMITDIDEDQQLIQNLDQSSTRKVINYFKLNIFNNHNANTTNTINTTNSSTSTEIEHSISPSNPMHASEIQPQIFKKRYFWNRNKNIKKGLDIDATRLLADESIDFEEDTMMADDSRLIIDPSQLITKDNSSNISNNYLKKDIQTASDFAATPISSSLFSEDFTSPEKLEDLELEHIEIDTKEIVPSIFIEDFKVDKKPRTFPKASDQYNSQSIILSKKLGVLPKTRGRKPSPILDSSKQFGCDYCERRFKRQEHLKRHIRSLHMCVKPYACHICEKKFSRSDNLSQHIKTHSH